MASQKHYESLDDGSEFSGPLGSLPPSTQPYGAPSDSDMDLSISDDYCAPPSAAAPQSEAEKRVFRAAAFLKKAQQEAEASEHCVFGARAAALELSKMHAKKVAAMNNAEKRLKAAKADLRAPPPPAQAAAASTINAAAVAAAAPEAAAQRVASPKASAKPKQTKHQSGGEEGAKQKKSLKKQSHH
jgi:hypothetical protein